MRTQIYLTSGQRERLDRRAAQGDRSMAAVIREAIDAYLGPAGVDLDTAASRTFGAAPNYDVPDRGEWGDRERRIYRA